MSPGSPLQAPVAWPCAREDGHQSRTGLWEPPDANALRRRISAPRGGSGPESPSGGSGLSGWDMADRRRERGGPGR